MRRQELFLLLGCLLLFAAGRVCAESDDEPEEEGPVLVSAAARGEGRRSCCLCRRSCPGLAAQCSKHHAHLEGQLEQRVAQLNTGLRQCAPCPPLCRRRRRPLASSPCCPPACCAFAVQVTCGSVIKLEADKTRHVLHSHEVSYGYGRGSGQQSVTGFPEKDSAGSLWVVRSNNVSDSQGTACSQCPVLLLLPAACCLLLYLVHCVLQLPGPGFNLSCVASGCCCFCLGLMQVLLLLILLLLSMHLLVLLLLPLPPVAAPLGQPSCLGMLCMHTPMHVGVHPVWLALLSTCSRPARLLLLPARPAGLLNGPVGRAEVKSG